jgi:hypothetical protein
MHFPQAFANLFAPVDAVTPMAMAIESAARIVISSIL